MGILHYRLPLPTILPISGILAAVLYIGESVCANLQSPDGCTSSRYLLYGLFATI